MSRKTVKFRSAFTRPDVSPADVLAFHRGIFGSLRMEGEGSDTDEGGEGGSESQTGADRGFPAETPLSEMTTEQREAYWKYQARKHESAAKSRADYDTIRAELDKLKAATQTDAEKALEQARADARDAAKAEARAEFAPMLVAAKLETALAGKLPADKVAGHVEFIDASKFLTASGEVDTDKVKQYADGLAPSGKQWPDMGQGKRGDANRAKGVSAGAELFAASRGKKTDS